MSLRIIGCLLFSAAGFHVAFIYSLYYADTLNCQISTFMYCFFSLVHCFLTTGLGCNLFIIFVLKREAQDYLFWVYWCVAVIGAGAFSLPPPFMNIITFFEVDGCWFDDVKHSWTFYYGPMFVMAVVNIILGVAVHTMLMIHRKEMAVLSKDVEERAELQYFVAGAGDGR
ncbi:hypothetical protein BC829DRAFT_443789 [Chytridium lagenaria]|nr:hypothetical protein BC829DRAFT_443789 [Chytridium lagenaria]